MNISEQNLQRIDAAMDAMRRAITGAKERLQEGLQLTRTQIEILLTLVNGPQTTTFLAGHLFLTQSAVTQTIDTLVRRGLVERHPDDIDRRVVRLGLTPSGHELTGRLRDLRRDYLSSLISRLTEPEFEALIAITRKFTEQFNDTKTATPNLRG